MRTIVKTCIAVAGCAGLMGCAATPREQAVAGRMMMVEMETSAGVINLELDGVRAPISTANFLMHARAGHYDGTIFHRVVPGFVVQGGGWTEWLAERAKADAAAGRKDSPVKNEWGNGLKNVKYSLAMARETEPDSATREFYININDITRLDTARATTGNAGYAVFGRVTEGFAVVDEIARGKTGSVKMEGVTDGSMENVPLRPVVIRRVRPK